jgi:hypothetical protein
MRFTSLLFIFHQTLKWVSKRNPAFKSYIGAIHQVKIMIKTADDNGRVSVIGIGKEVKLALTPLCFKLQRRSGVATVTASMTCQAAESRPLRWCWSLSRKRRSAWMT